MSNLANTGIGAIVLLVAGVVLRWLQQRTVKAARNRAESAATAAQAGEQAAVGATQQATEAKADAKLAQEQSAIGGMDDDALLADAAARVRRERAERAAGGTR